jgi:chloramphenicol 3-O-phosphotransferase
MGSIIVLSGPVGAGKTTVGKALIEGLEAPAAYLEGDDFWFFLTKPKPDRRANFPTIMRAMFRAAAALATDGYQVVLDFSMPLWFLERAVARAPDTPTHFVVLRPSLEMCVGRAAQREEGRIDDYGPYRELYNLFDAPDRHIVRNDDLAPGDAARIVHEGLASGRFRFP